MCFIQFCDLKGSIFGNFPIPRPETKCTLEDISFRTTNGVRQGGPESPPLFNLYIDFVMRIFCHACEQEGIDFLQFLYDIPASADTDKPASADIDPSALADADTLAFAGPPTSAFADSDMSALAGRKTSALAGEKNRKGSKCSAKRSLTLPWIGYADDIVLFLPTVPGLQKCLDLSVKIFTRFALKVNVSKTETQLANMPNTTDQLPPSLIKLNSVDIKNTDI